MKIIHGAFASTLLLFTTHLAIADASFRETSQMTGGSLVDTLKSVSFFGAMKNALAPIVTTTMVHGNRKAVVSKESMEITDLDRETITHVDLVKKTYSVITFAEMRQAIADMPAQLDKASQQMKQAQAQPAQQPPSNLKTTFEVSAKNTGVTKVVNGLDAQEQVITMKAHITDTSAPATDPPTSMTYEVTTDAWVASDTPQEQEIRDFDMRMGKKLMAGVDLSAFRKPMAANPGLASMFGQQPGSAAAMAEMEKEVEKLKGTRVLVVTRMGGTATGMPAANANASTPASSPSSSGPAQNGSVTGQVASDTATQTAAGEANKMGVFGSALTNSAIGAWRRKKTAAATPAAVPASANTTTAASGTAASGTAQAGTGAQSAVLMEMTTQKLDFSSEPLPSSSFEVPAGFTKVSTPGRMQR